MKNGIQIQSHKYSLLGLSLASFSLIQGAENLAYRLEIRSLTITQESFLTNSGQPADQMRGVDVQAEMHQPCGAFFADCYGVRDAGER